MIACASLKTRRIAGFEIAARKRHDYSKISSMLVERLGTQQPEPASILLRARPKNFGRWVRAFLIACTRRLSCRARLTRPWVAIVS